MAGNSCNEHGHSQSVGDVLKTVEAICVSRKLQFTATRRRVLEIMLQEDRSMGAYEILEFLRTDGHAAQPPIAYRALDFLVKNGFAHKIEKRNAFVACTHPGEDHTPAFMICRSCDHIEEAHREPEQGQLDKAARAAGFQIERTVVEAEGLCPKCQD